MHEGAKGRKEALPGKIVLDTSLRIGPLHTCKQTRADYSFKLHASVCMCGEDQSVNWYQARDYPEAPFSVFLAPSCTSKRRSYKIPGVIQLKVKHRPGDLQSALSSTRLFACMERNKVPNSRGSRNHRFPALSTLAHIEKKVKQDSRCDLSKGYATPWRLAIRFKLHRFVCM